MLFGAPMTVVFDGRDVLFGSLRKRFTGERPASLQEPTVGVPLQGLAGRGGIDDSALLLAGEESVWLFADAYCSAILGTEVVLYPSSRVVGDCASFEASDGMIFVAESVETFAAGSYAQGRGTIEIAEPRVREDEHESLRL